MPFLRFNQQKFQRPNYRYNTYIIKNIILFLYYFQLWNSNLAVVISSSRDDDRGVFVTSHEVHRYACTVRYDSIYYCESWMLQVEAVTWKQQTFEF